jgi:hypothetical protein
MTLPATPHARAPQHRAPVVHPAGRAGPPASLVEPGALRRSPAQGPEAGLPAGSARASRWPSVPACQIPSDLVRLCALRVVQDDGPIAGLDALNRLAPLARMLGEVPPTFPLLHDLEDSGLLEASASLPRTYAITASGRREAGRLASSSSALLAERLDTGMRLDVMLARRH